MTFAQFLTQFDSVLEAFPNKFPKVVLERINEKVQGLTPGQMRELCNLIIDTCEHAPRVAKVSELANLVKARNHQGLFHAQSEIRPDCAFCMDLQVIRAVSTDGTFETLMHCECSTESHHGLPIYARHWAPLFQKHKCPAEWFTPEVLARNEDGSMKLENVNRRRDYWRAKLDIAKQYWINAKKESEIGA
jgi:hypothetical protein